MSPHLILLDPDLYMNKMLTFLLEDGGYQVTTLSDPRLVGDFLKENTVDLILLEVTLPHIDGLALCATVRREHPDIPVIFLSARGMVSDKIAGFEHGADDYVAKPFEPTELIVRIQAVLRRYRRSERNLFGMIIKVGNMTLDLGQLQFSAPGRPAVLLTPTEMKILECLMRNANAFVSRETLIERTWGFDYDGETNRIEVYIRRLRTKIEDDPNNPTYIRTMRRVGYVFKDGRHVARPPLRIFDAGGGGAQGDLRVPGWSAIGD